MKTKLLLLLASALTASAQAYLFGYSQLTADFGSGLLQAYGSTRP